MRRQTLTHTPAAALDGGVDGPLVQRKCACGGSCDDCSRKRTLSRSAAAGSPATSFAPPVVHDVLRSSGTPLDARTRAFMEPRFGHDFSSVRVHTGDHAARSANAVGAEAFTVGRHIVFDHGRFAPETTQGRSLLAHELAHTIQQRSADAGDEPLAVGDADATAEHDAHRVASAAAAGRPAAPHHTPVGVARASRNFMLTFDDGPHAAALGTGSNRTEKVLDTLCSNDVKAGFFVQTAAEDAKTGAPMRGSSTVGQKLIKRMAADGHLVGIHTGGKTDHESHIAANKAGRLSSELKSAKKFLKGLTTATPTLVRPPFGKFDAGVSSVYKSLTLTNVLWDIDGDQGKNLPLADLKQRITDGISAMISAKWKGSTPLAPSIVVLYHDIQKGTANNLGTLINHIKSETSSQTGGQDTATFPASSCKGAGGAGGGAGSGGAAPKDTDTKTPEDTNVPQSEADGGDEEEVA